MVDLQTLINLLENQKKDIIGILSVQVKSVEERVEYFNEGIKEFNEKIEARVVDLEKTVSARGLTCLPEIEKLKPLEKTVAAFNWFASHKILSLTLVLITLFILETAVVYLFARVEFSEIFDLITK